MTLAIGNRAKKRLHSVMLFLHVKLVTNRKRLNRYYTVTQDVPNAQYRTLR